MKDGAKTLILTKSIEVMSKKQNGAISKTTPQQSRRKRALKLLEKQLKSGVKMVKNSFIEKVPLSDKDIKRMNTEIINLQNKL